MQDRTFSLAIATFPYGGNGGVSNEYPAVGDYKTEVILKAKADSRIQGIHDAPFSDTPITMTRNESVLWARRVGADFLLMIDSDMQPDCELREDLEAKPFWDTSLDFCMKHYDDGPNVVCAPYCGPPPIENVYAFYWGSNETGSPNDRGKIEQFSREHASVLRGIQPVAAQPTGLILFDMRAFELTDPLPYYNELRKQGRSREEAMALTHPWFYYEYEDIYQSKKSSTEDVTATRDISFIGWLVHGRETIYCNWDAWAGHVKPKVVRKPRPIDSKSMHAQYRHVVESRQTQEKKLHFVGAGKKTERPLFFPNGKPFNGAAQRKVQERQEKQAADDGIVRVGMMTPKRDLDFLTKLVKEVKPKVAVEVGSWVGESAIAICKGLPAISLLTCVDTFEGSPHDKSGRFVAQHGKDEVIAAFRKNTAIYQSAIELVRSTSSTVAKDWQSRKFDLIDFLYIDADHEYQSVKQNILEWLPNLSPDGVIAGHDFNASFPGVERAVRELFHTFESSNDHDVWHAKVGDLKPEFQLKHESVP